MPQQNRPFAIWIGRARAIIWTLIIGAVLYFNLRLYSASPLARQNDQVPPQLLVQLAANHAAIEAGYPAQMQELFPEGYYFCFLVHGLGNVELAMRDPSYSDEAIAEATWCLDQLDSPEGKAPFPIALPPDHGMFYSAWKCSLRSGVVALGQGNNAEQLDRLRQECDAIATALADSPTPFLPSYYGSAWPCDTVPAIHALSVYDRVTKEDRYRGVIANWLEDARERLDPETGLLPHTANLPDGKHVGVSRATSQMIMLRLLPDIDPPFAKQQYETFRERHLTTFLGAPCLLEYPSGISGPGDVDSGPLIFGRSLSATVLMMGVAQIYGDQSVADAIAQSGEVVGLPWTWWGKKQYAAGLMPIGDIMVTYAHVARPWFAKTQHFPNSEHHVSAWWRWKIHAISIVAFLPIALLVWPKWLFRGRPKPDPQPQEETVNGQNAVPASDSSKP